MTTTKKNEIIDTIMALLIELTETEEQAAPVTSPAKAVENDKRF